MNESDRGNFAGLNYPASRRRFLGIMAGAGLVTSSLLLAACGGDDDDSDAEDPTADESGAGEEPTATTEAAEADDTPAAETAPADAPAEPTGEVVVAQGPEVTSLDASLQTGMLTFNLSIHIMEPLLMRGEDLQPEPFLAETMELVDDTTILIRIRDDVIFHNGDPLTVDDVVFTLQRVLDPDAGSQHTIYLQGVESVEALDDREVQITLTTPDMTIPGRLALIPIVPKKVVEELGNEEFNANPVGSGPYRFVSWERGDRVTLEAFPDYWRGPASIKTLVFRGIPEDATRIAELQTGAVDIATNVPTHMIPELDQQDSTQALAVDSLRAFFVILNSTQPPFDDVRMRQAANYAVDRTLITEGVLDGYATPISQPFGPAVFGYNPEMEGYYTYDPDRARSLMAEAGYEDGVDVTMFGPSGRYLKDTEVVQNIAAQLEEVGFRVDIQLLEFQAYFQGYINIEEPHPDLHLGFWSNANNTADADYNLSLNVHSGGQAGASPPGPEYDALIDEARATTDVEERKQQYQALVKKIVEDALWIFLYNQVDIYGVTTRVQNWEPRSDELIYLYGASVSD